MYRIRGEPFHIQNADRGDLRRSLSGSCQRDGDFAYGFTVAFKVIRLLPNVWDKPPFPSRITVYATLFSGISVVFSVGPTRSVTVTKGRRQVRSPRPARNSHALALPDCGPKAVSPIFNRSLTLYASLIRIGAGLRLRYDPQGDVRPTLRCTLGHDRTMKRDHRIPSF